MSKQSLNIGVIGYGYWGPNLVRNFLYAENCIVKTVADFREERLDALSKLYPALSRTINSDDIFLDPGIDAVVIATPVSTHYELVKKALLAGKHVLVEKPITADLREAEELMALAAEKKRCLMVDHTFVYTPAVRRIRQLIDDNVLGSLRYFDSTRINLGLFQPDVNVLWDLASHDVSILLYLYDALPYSVNATGISHTGNGVENIAFMTLNYDNGFIAHFNCSWSSPVKVRKMLIDGDKKMVVYNDIEPSEKVRVYDSGYVHTTDESKAGILVDYRMGDVFIPQLSRQEALTGIVYDFCLSVINGTDPVASADAGWRVVKILEAANESLQNRGKEILLNWD